MPAGGGRLALSVSKAMLRSGGVIVGDAADFEIELAVQRPSWAGRTRRLVGTARWAVGSSA